MVVSTKPFLLRAYYDWALKNDWTPHVIIRAGYPNSYLPKEYLKNNEILLNVSPEAVRNLELGDEFIEFDARFDGVSHSIYAPVEAVVALYAFENNEGIMFDEDQMRYSKKPSEQKPQTKTDKKPKRPHLTIIE